MSVTVIIPAFNAGDFIRDAIESALEQTKPVKEIIVVNDGSTDDTSFVTIKLQKQDDRIKIIDHASRKGPSAARNTAFSQATGDWIALLDADDIFLKPRLEKMLAVATSRHLDLLADNLQIFDTKTGKTLGGAFPDEEMSRLEPIDLTYLLNHDIPSGGKTQKYGIGYMKPIIRRKFIENNSLFYDEDIHLGEDFLFYCRCIIANGKFGVIPDVFYRYSLHESSASSNVERLMDLFDGNQRIMDLVRTINTTNAAPGDNDVETLLQTRGNAMAYQAFSRNLKAGRYNAASRIASLVPPKIILNKMLEATLHRLK